MEDMGFKHTECLITFLYLEEKELENHLLWNNNRITGIYVRAGGKANMKLVVSFWLLILGDKYVENQFTILSSLLDILETLNDKIFEEIPQRQKTQ